MRLFALGLLLVGGVWGDQPMPPAQEINVPFRIFQTQNIFNLLRLDTRTGSVWQLEWSTDGEEGRFVVPINWPVIPDAKKVGRFTLYPTENIYNFILLDQDTGDAWQLQWSLEDQTRAAVPIKPRPQLHSSAPAVTPPPCKMSTAEDVEPTYACNPKTGKPWKDWPEFSDAIRAWDRREGVREFKKDSANAH